MEKNNTERTQTIRKSISIDMETLNKMKRQARDLKIGCSSLIRLYVLEHETKGIL